MTPEPSRPTNPQAKPQTPLPPFTALVAAWNEGPFIEEHIRSFFALSWPGAELIVVAGGKDDTYARARALEGLSVRVVEQKPGTGKQKSLRQAYALAKHDLIFLTDSDCLYDRKALEALVRPVASGEFQAATGGSFPLPAQQANPLVQYQDARLNAIDDRKGPEADGLLGRNALLTRACLEAIGRFDADVPTGTDYHMTQQLLKHGFKIAFVGDSRVPSEFPETPSTYLRQQRRWIKNLIVHESGMGTAIRRAVILALGVVLSPLALLLPGLLKLLFFVPWALTLRSRLSDLQNLARHGRKPGLAAYLALPYFTLLDQLAVLGAVWDMADPERRKRW